MLKLSCLCGQIRVETNKKPDYINDCNCTLCSKAGTLWGYFHPSEVGVTGTTTRYCRRDKDDPSAQLHFCATCGSTTHWVLTESAVSRFGDGMMGVNMRLADESELVGIQVRYPDGRAWSGEGTYDFVREARILGRRATSD